MSTPLARWSRRVVFHIHAIQTKTFIPRDGDRYEMLQLWVSNGATEDAEVVRCHTQWTTDSPLLNVKTDPGLWLQISPFEDTQHLGGVAGDVDLPARCGMGRVGMAYLRLAVKYAEDEYAYVVTPQSYRRFARRKG